MTRPPEKVVSVELHEKSVYAVCTSCVSERVSTSVYIAGCSSLAFALLLFLFHATSCYLFGIYSLSLHLVADRLERPSVKVPHRLLSGVAWSGRP